MKERLEVDPRPAGRNQRVGAQCATVVKTTLDHYVDGEDREEDKYPDKGMAEDVALVDALLRSGWLESAHELLSNTFARLILQSESPPIIKKITIEMADANPKFDVVPLKAVLYV